MIEGRERLQWSSHLLQALSNCYLTRSNALLGQKVALWRTGNEFYISSKPFCLAKQSISSIDQTP